MTQPERRPHPLETPPQPAPTRAPSASAAGPRFSLGNTPPYLTQAALALMVALFILRAASPELDQQIQQAGWNLPQAVFQENQMYRLFTSIFLHAGIWVERWRGGFALAPIGALHLLFNAYMLYHFGGALERILGHLRFAAIFTIGGLCASILSAVTGDPCIPSLGASGAVFALIGAQVILLLRNRRLFGQRGNHMLRQLLIWTLINFGIGIASTLPGSALRIDNWAHFGGLVAGLALAAALIPRYQFNVAAEESGWQVKLRPQAASAALNLIPAAVIAAFLLAFLWRAATLPVVFCRFF